MKDIRKWLAALVSVIILVSGCLCFAAAEEKAEDEQGIGSYVFLEDGTAKLIYYISDKEDITVPAETDGRPVTAVGEEALCMCENMKRVTIPDSVTIIEGNPFTICEKLEEILVSPDHPALEVRDSVLFSKADARLIVCPTAVSFKSYTVPDGTKVIGNDAFWDCKLNSLMIPEGVKEIGDRAFYYCENLKDVTIPCSVKKIGESAFTGNSSLESFTLSEGVEELGDCIFWGCERLTSIAIPDSVKTIGSNPFVRCNGLKEIMVSPDHPVLEMKDGALFSRPDSRLVYYPLERKDEAYGIPAGTKAIGGFAFWYNDYLTSVTIPDSVTEIGNDAFGMCRKLKDAAISESVKMIGEAAFSGCESMTSVTIPKSVTRIDRFGFQGCRTLKEVTIPESVTEICEWAFCDCFGLEFVLIPDGVKEIGPYTFGFCDSLKSVTIPDSVELIEDSAFIECGEHVTFTVGRDSYAQQYCERFGYAFEIRDK